MNVTADGSVSHDHNRRLLRSSITDDDRLTRGDALFDERHDQGAELGIGAVEADLVRVGMTSFPAARSPGIRRPPVGFPGPQRLNQPANRAQPKRPGPGVPGPARSW